MITYMICAADAAVRHDFTFLCRFFLLFSLNSYDFARHVHLCGEHFSPAVCAFYCVFHVPGCPHRWTEALPSPVSFLHVDLIFIWPFYRSSLNKATQRAYGKRTAQHHNRSPHPSKPNLFQIGFHKTCEFTGTSLENSLSLSESLFRATSSVSRGPREGDSKFKPAKR